MPKTMFEYLLDDSPGEIGVLPIVDHTPEHTQEKVPMRQQIKDAATTAVNLAALAEEPLEVSEDDAHIAADLFESGREPSKYELNTSGIVVQLDAMLDKYDHDLVQDATRIRRFVTNRLLEETEDVDPKVRLKAYEMLGKVTEVGLFTERKEVVVKNQSDEELKSALKSKLEKLIGGGRAENGAIVENSALEHDPTDV